MQVGQVQCPICRGPFTRTHGAEDDIVEGNPGALVVSARVAITAFKILIANGWLRSFYVHFVSPRLCAYVFSRGPLCPINPDRFDLEFSTLLHSRHLANLFLPVLQIVHGEQRNHHHHTGHLEGKIGVENPDNGAA